MQKNQRGSSLFSAMAQITAQSVFLMAIDWYEGGVRGMAHSHNLEVSDWYADDKEMRKDANIIAVDYFASSDIVDICLDINQERMKDPGRWNAHNDRF